MIKAVIFDLDGTLVDSQPLQFKSHRDAFNKFGYDLTLKAWKEWIHNSMSSRKWVEKNNLQIDYLAVRAEWKKNYKKLVDSELKLKPGAKNLVNKLYKKFPLGVASSSSIELINLILKKFRLKAKFMVAISDTEMERGKPFPDIFLKAAVKLKVKPNECLVFEDSVAGLTAAKSASMKCIVCPDKFCPLDKKKFKSADRIVNRLKDVTMKMISGY